MKLVVSFLYWLVPLACFLIFVFLECFFIYWVFKILGVLK